MIIDIEFKFDLNSGKRVYAPRNIRIFNPAAVETFPSSIGEDLAKDASDRRSAPVGTSLMTLGARRPVSRHFCEILPDAATKQLTAL